MRPTPDDRPPSNARARAGWLLTALTGPFLLFDAGVKLVHLPVAVEATTRLGYAEELLLPLGVVLFACTALYLVPRTAVLGAVLLTGYLGGATATHVRVGDPVFFPIVVGAMVWGGLVLRDPRVLALLPVARRTAP